MRGFVFVLVGETRRIARIRARCCTSARRRTDVDDLFRMVGHCADMPAAFAAADLVAVPAIEPPLLGRVVAEAQAMGGRSSLPTSACLPEHMVAPPRMPEEVRTGWLAQPGDADRFRAARSRARWRWTLCAYRGMAARARQFAEYMFSPRERCRGDASVYTSLLAREL